MAPPVIPAALIAPANSATTEALNNLTKQMETLVANYANVSALATEQQHQLSHQHQPTFQSRQSRPQRLFDSNQQTSRNN